MCVCVLNWSACGHVCKYSASVCVCVFELVSLWPDVSIALNLCVSMSMILVQRGLWPIPMAIRADIV